MCQLLQFLVERFLQDILVDISEEMNQASLLGTLDGVVPGIESDTKTPLGAEFNSSRAVLASRDSLYT